MVSMSTPPSCIEGAGRKATQKGCKMLHMGILDHRTVNVCQMSEYITSFMETLKIGPDQAHLGLEDRVTAVLRKILDFPKHGNMVKKCDSLQSHEK